MKMSEEEFLWFCEHRDNMELLFEAYFPNGLFQSRMIEICEQNNISYRTQICDKKHIWVNARQFVKYLNNRHIQKPKDIWLASGRIQKTYRHQIYVLQRNTHTKYLQECEAVVFKD